MRPPQNTPLPLRGGGVETPNVALTKDDLIVHYNPKVTIETVDMGNGVLWATSNITRDANGNYKLADNPEDFGCYFSWGDVVGHNSTEYNDGYSFSDSNYSSRASGNGHGLTIDIPSGDPTYDAATATLGGNWRMPTEDELNYLATSCNPTWTTRNGIEGYLFTNPNDSSKTIFFPAAGYYTDTYWDSSTHYWSSTISDNSEYASDMRLSGGSCWMGGLIRARGCSVRAVKSV